MKSQSNSMLKVLYSRSFLCNKKRYLIKLKILQWSLLIYLVTKLCKSRCMKKMITCLKMTQILVKLYWIVTKFHLLQTKLKPSKSLSQKNPPFWDNHCLQVVWDSNLGMMRTKKRKMMKIYLENEVKL